jgi:hypothetical protein
MLALPFTPSISGFLPHSILVPPFTASIPGESIEECYIIYFTPKNILGADEKVPLT